MSGANNVIDKTAKIVTDNVAIGKEVIGDMGIINNNPSSNSGNMIMYLIVIVILAMLGINIFGYAAIVTETLSDIFGPIIKPIAGLFGYYTGETIKQTVETSAEGTKFGVDIAKDVVVNTVDLANEQTKNTQDAINEMDAELIENKPNAVNIKNDINPKNNISQKESPYVDRAELLDSFEKVKENVSKNNNDYIADDAGSTIQNGGIGGNQGWCYVGEDRGFRSCVEVGTSHECMSGNVFPSKEVCINPSLRH